MRAARDCLSIAAAAVPALAVAALAVVALGFLPAGETRRAYAETEPSSPILDGTEGLQDRRLSGDWDDEARPLPNVLADTAAQFTTVYNVSLGRFNLGNFSISGTVRDGKYRMRGRGTFSVLKGIAFHWQGAIGGAGELTTAGPNPANYSFSYSDGKAAESMRIAFGDGYVKEVTISPRRRPLPGTIPVRKEQLQGVVDPLSGIFLTARSENPHADLSVCNQLLPVFDGYARFDLVLKPKKRVMVQNKGPGSYTGPAAVCRVKFVPISGYPRNDPGIRQLRQSNEIEAWLIPLRGTGMYVPYRIQMPTAVGYGVATATSLRVGRPSRASAD